MISFRAYAAVIVVGMSELRIGIAVGRIFAMFELEINSENGLREDSGLLYIPML